MTTLVRYWDAFWFRARSTKPLGLFRIALGLTILQKMLLLLPLADDFFSERGMFTLEMSRRVFPNRLCLFDFLPSDCAVVFFCATILIAVFFTAGLLTRVATALLYVAMASVEYRNPLLFDSGDRLVILLLFFGMFAPLGRSFSVDRLLKRDCSKEAEAGPIWAARLMQLQICAMYFWSAYAKLNQKSWSSGEAMYWISHNLQYVRGPMPQLLVNTMEGVHLLTYGTLAFEMSFPFLVWFGPTRKYVLFAGLLFHLAILGSMDIPTFQLVVLSSYLLFLGDEEITAFGRTR